MNASYINTQKINDVGNLCQDPDTKGFDLQAGQSWIYPTNYPVRDYQYSIVQQALYKNTLVSLPTGLGKTFIAAVVMYNFYRWYPHDKVIFMAPTRPLVKQQMDACYDIMAIPQDATAELTGTKVQQSRSEIWQNKRVFFITPQVLQNDLSIIIELGSKIKCLVFDEAHRAKGNHAYCEVIRKLLPKNKLFRVLALSATPGNSSKDVLDVMNNLLISHLEFRNEESLDVKPYVFERALETVVVPLGEKLQQIKNQYIQILEKYTRTLMKYKVIYGNCGNLTKGKIFMVMKEFQAKNSGSRNPNYAEIMKSLNICVTLYHAYETLVRCGLRAFLNFYKEHINNPLLQGNASLLQIMDDLQEYLGPDPEVKVLPDGTYAEIPASIKFGHPKFYELRDILIIHFQNLDDSTRAIVFFEYRESVIEAYALLTRSYPLIKSRIFVGQGGGVRQKDQINTVKAFREGTCNTLLSTCIGEEGLDVGEVDLIICFDIANKSPIRMIQRMGRTGRKKEGRVIVLVTEGREQQTLKDCLIYKSNLGNFASNSELLESGKYRNNPKMIPSYIQPKCQKMFITVKKPVLMKNSNLKDMLRSLSDGAKFNDDLEIVEIQERIKDDSENLWNKSKEEFLHYEPQESKINFMKYLEKQRVFQAKETIKESKQSEIFVSLLQFADSKRYNIPVVSRPIFSNFNQNKCLKQGDIRTMFSKPSINILSQEIPSQMFDLEKEKDVTQLFPPELFEELSIYLSIETSIKPSCKCCSLLFECPKIFYNNSQPVDLSTLVVPDISIVENITAEDLEVFANSLTPKSKELYREELEVDNDIFDDIEFSKLEEEMCQKLNKNTLAYDTPRNFDSILNSFRIQENVDSPQKIEKSYVFDTPKSFSKILNLLESHVDKEVPPNLIKKPFSNNLEVIYEHTESYDKILSFFKLSSLEEFFEETKCEIIDLDETVIYTPVKKPKTSSPDLFEESPVLFPSEKNQDQSLIIEGPESPILSTCKRVQQLKTKKKLFDNSAIEENEMAKKPNLSILNRPSRSFFESNKNKTVSSSHVTSSSHPSIDISDLCDLSQFGLKREILQSKENSEKMDASKIEVDIGDICDLSIFGLEGNTGKNINIEENKITNNNEIKNGEHEEENKKEKLSIDDLCDMSQFFSKSVSKKSENREIEATTSNNITTNTQTSSLIDFCDFSSFVSDCDNRTSKKNDIQFLKENPEKYSSETSDTKLKKTKETVNHVTIDLTDSDFELSPVKKTSQPLSKTPTQLSITQMLSLIAKSDSQKENKTPKMKKYQLSLSNRDNAVQSKQTTPKSSQKKMKNTPKTKPKFNICLAGDSDDEFEDNTFRSPIFAKPKPIPVEKNETEKSSSSKEIKKKRKKFCEFLDQEAVLSEDGSILISEDEESGEDCFEASFVADETEDFFNNTNMHVKYLQSVKSPVRGNFKIPAKFRFNVSNIFSQEVSNEDNTYMNDSFCVGSQEVENCDNNLSELELLEMQLKEEKKNKKRKKSDDNGVAKRRRILVINDDSD